MRRNRVAAAVERYWLARFFSGHVERYFYRALLMDVTANGEWLVGLLDLGMEALIEKKVGKESGVTQLCFVAWSAVRYNAKRIGAVHWGAVR